MRPHPAGPAHGDLLHEALRGGPPDDLGRLDPAVWPLGVARTTDGVLTVRGHDVRDLVREHGTPAFFLDEADFRSRCRDYREAFGGALVFYAAKAFLCTGVVQWIEQEGLGLDVCTGGELAVALNAGFPGDRLLLHGNNKSVAELSAALDAGVGRIVVDSFDEIDRLARLAAERRTTVRVLVRATVGVEAHTHEFIATAHEDQKFGFSLADGDVHEAVRRVLSAPSLELVGVHSHIGSQIFDTSGFEVAAHRVVGLLGALRDEHGIELPELNLGGGLGIVYTSADDPVDVAETARSLRDIVTRECAAHGLALPTLAIEPGRGIAGPGTITVYEVGTVKPVKGLRTFVSVDGGMSDNIRTALYGADYTVTLASRDSAAPPMLSRVVGKHCESGDVVVTDTWLPSDVTPGDLLAVAATGAYCRSMASSYNHVPRPPVVAVRDDGSQLLLRRETIQDLLALEPPTPKGEPSTSVLGALRRKGLCLVFLGMTAEGDQQRLKGNLDLLLLSVLARGPAHGYAVIAALRDRSAGTFDLPEGTVYPALHRLERAHLLSARWQRGEDSGGGRRRKVYVLTTAGEAALATERGRWQRFTAGMGAVLHAEGLA